MVGEAEVPFWWIATGSIVIVGNQSVVTYNIAITSNPKDVVGSIALAESLTALTGRS